tara:strand:- start:86 stop:481 length:396 start_codon:yes stop_codon:yes gene_type:complete
MTEMSTDADTFEQSPNFGQYVGNCKWFNSRIGYGFVTIVSEGENKGKDIFVHHSGVKPKNSNFRTLQKGEYISLDVENGTNGLQGVNITGVFGGPLMCDNVIYRNNYRNNKFNQNNSTEHSTQGNTEMMES